MDLHFEELLKQITDFMKTEANTDTVIGKQFDLGEFKCIGFHIIFAFSYSSVFELPT